MMMKRSHEEWVLQEPTLFNLGSEGMFLRCPIIANQSFNYNFTAASGIPNSPKSILAANNQFSADSGEPNRAKRLKGTEAEETHDDEVKASDAGFQSPLKFKIKLNPKSEPESKPKPKPKSKSKPKTTRTAKIEPAPLSLPFFKASTSPEKIKATLDSKIDQIKSDLVSALKKIDESFACEVAAKIKVDHVGEKPGRDPFVIKKSLEVSDVRDLCRLMLKREWLNELIFPLWRTEDKDLVHSDSGLRVKVYDQDVQEVHELTLKRWKSNTCYLLNNNWKRSFVNTRNLQKGDTIGLYWDKFYSHFCFSVLQRNPESSSSPSLSLSH